MNALSHMYTYEGRNTDYHTSDFSFGSYSRIAVAPLDSPMEACHPQATPTSGAVLENFIIAPNRWAQR